MQVSETPALSMDGKLLFVSSSTQLLAIDVKTGHQRLQRPVSLLLNIGQSDPVATSSQVEASPSAGTT